METSPDNRFLLSADLGIDEVLIDKVDAQNGTLTANNPPYARLQSASGPRHIAFSGDGRRVYLINETASTIAAFDRDPQRGTLRELQTISTLPADFNGKSYTAEIAMGKAGKFLYGSNRGHDSIAAFSIHAEDGKLIPIEYTSTQGQTPHSFQIDPSGRLLFAANQGPSDVTIFHVDQRTGRLTPIWQKLEIRPPVCVVFAPRIDVHE